MATAMRSEGNDFGNDFVRVLCTNGYIAISKKELDGILGAGTILRYLYNGHPSMHQDPNPDVFSQYGVSTADFNVIRACIRTGKLPNDSIANLMIGSGELRNIADSLGGFVIIDKIFEERQNTGQQTQIDTPAKDTARRFEWRARISDSDEQVQAEIDTLNADGFVMTSAFYAGFHQFLYFRRSRASGQQTETTAEYKTQIDCPAKDSASVFQWRTVRFTTFKDMDLLIKTYETEGFELASTFVLDKGNISYAYLHFRRPRTMDAC